MPETAIWCSASERSIHSEPTKRSTSLSLYWIRKGALSMDSSMAARMGCSSASSTSCTPPACASSTKPNSPACASASAVRSALPGVAPNMRESTAISANLNSTGAANSSSTSAEPVGHHGHVQLHADGDEEQAQQQIAERLDVLFHLVPVFGFGNQHAGEKSAQRERQAGQLGGPGEAEGDQQHVQHEQLVRTPPRHDVEPAAHQLLPGEQDQQQHHRGLRQRQRQHRRQMLGRLRQRRDQDQAAAPPPGPETAARR